MPGPVLWPLQARRYGKNRRANLKFARASTLPRAASRSLAYVYFKQEPGRRAAAKLRTRDKARRIAANVTKLLELIAGRHS